MNKKVGLGIGIVVLVLLLAGGAFTAVQLLTAQENGGGGGQLVFEDVMMDGDGNAVTVSTTIDPSPDLPQEKPVAGGIFLREEDSSYFLGTGNISISAETVNGETSVSADHSGPEVEVVVGHDTVFYQDVTDIDWNPSESAERHFVQEVQQVDRPAEMLDAANMTVWGEKNGDRVIATVIVFSEQH